MIPIGIGDVVKGFSFSLATRIEYGAGVSQNLREAVTQCQGSRILVVTDPGVARAGLLSPLTDILHRGGISFTVFSDVEVNPRAETVDRVAGMAVEEDVDTIVAIGGGSSIDAAKGIAAVVSHGGTIRDYEGFGKLRHAVMALVAIPTTAGSGSEVTTGAVVTDAEQRLKITVGKPDLAPRVALIDPKLTVTLPPSITAATGIDALTHAVEAYTARCSNPVSDALALHAIELISNHVRRAVKAGQDLEARSAMMLGSLLAGISFGNAAVASVHSMAEIIGGLFDVPHGVANAIFLPYVMGYNVSTVPERTARIGRAMGIGTGDRNRIQKTARQTVLTIHELIRELKIPTLRETGVSRTDLRRLAKLTDTKASTPHNPREIGETDYLDLFERALNEVEPV